IWRGEVELPLGRLIEAKLVVLGPGEGEQRWEAGPNRTLTLQPPPREDWLLPAPPTPHAATTATAVTDTANSAAGSSSASLSAATTSPASSSSSSSPSPSTSPSPSPSSSSACGSVSGHYVVLCHWGITGCTQALYRPNLAAPSSEMEDEEAGEESSRQENNTGSLTTSGGGDAISGSSGSSGLTDREVLSLVHFTVPQHVTVPGQHLVLVGSLPALGGWNPAGGVQLRWGPGHVWSAELPVGRLQDFEAKVVYYENGSYSWEPGPNRSVRLSEVLAGSGGRAG
ncbi:hypothetical protein Agub_g8092, partial [Astrephomene gubernaculifera]